MTSNPLFSLDNRRPTRRFICPACGKREFKRYVDKSGNLFPDEGVGRCNRELNCGYHLSPKQFFAGQKTLEVGSALYRPFPTSNVLEVRQRDFSTISPSTFEATKKAYQSNCFYAYLLRLFGTRLSAELAERFHLGTSKYWPGATVFWQVDCLGNVRTGKIMLYDPECGKRVKHPFNHIQWAHTVVGEKDYTLRQCLFGLHQLLSASPETKVCIVESEKTAMLMTAILPDFLWMATGGLHNLHAEKLRSLKKRSVRLFPDLGCYERWSQKARELQKAGFDVSISNLIESRAAENDRSKGFDLSDYFVNPDPIAGWALSGDGYPIFWDR